MHEWLEKWNSRYREAISTPDPAVVLVQNAHLLPSRGIALDLACGLGANALFLAERGLDVHAWDLSPVAITRLQQEARHRGVALETAARDIEAAPPAPDSFDVIIVARYLERALAKPIMDALRPGGLLYYQTFTRARVDDIGPKNDDYRLSDNELLRLFAGLRLVVYREEGLIGDLGRGFRNEAMLVAQKSG